LITGFNLSKDVWRWNANVNIISVGCTVENNLIHGCHIGVELAPGDSAKINKNIISHVDTGIAMYGTKLSMISHNIISTILHTNNEYCIEMGGTGAGNTIMRNNLTHSYFGLSIYGAKQTIIKENNIANNKYGDFAYNRCSFFVKYRNNYWGGKTGPIVIQGIIPIFYPKPFGHIGEFDIPYYRIDWHPAKEPYDIPGMR